MFININDLTVIIRTANLTFRLWGEPVNLREQHDAYEFFNTLVDNIDEGLKSAGFKTSCSNVLGGSFADQKICKQCPHRLVIKLFSGPHRQNTHNATGRFTNFIVITESVQQ